MIDRFAGSKVEPALVILRCLCSYSRSRMPSKMILHIVSSIKTYSHRRLQCPYTLSYIDCRPHILALRSLYIVFVQVIHEVSRKHKCCFYQTYISTLQDIYNVCTACPTSLVPYRSENDYGTEANPASCGDGCGMNYDGSPCHL